MLKSIILLFGISAAIPAFAQSPLLQEQFDKNAAGWPLKVEDGVKSMQIVNGKLVIRNFSDVGSWSIIDPSYDQSNLTISISAKHLKGVTNNAFGLVFGADLTNTFVFGISQDGHFTVLKYTGTKPEFIVPWTETASIQKTPGRKNVLTVSNKGKLFSFYVNDTLVRELSLETYGKRIGVITNGMQEIEFDDLTVMKGRGKDKNKK